MLSQRTPAGDADPGLAAYEVPGAVRAGMRQLIVRPSFEFESPRIQNSTDTGDTIGEVLCDDLKRCHGAQLSVLSGCERCIVAGSFVRILFTECLCSADKL